ncbi:hypothetical protein [Mucisphaera sp.]|uniref:hypothetical protein n=1 Tax=Mucisphaera sp. TaxID=2913024 RepID=UPI003D126136
MKIDFKPSSHGKHLVTVTVGNDLIHAHALKLADEKQRQQFAKLAHHADERIDPDDLCRQLMNAAVNPPTTDPAPEQVEASSTEDAEKRRLQLLDETPQHIRLEAEQMLASASLLDEVCDDVERLGVAGERELIQTLYLVGTSRVLERPINAIVQGHSSGGKSHVIAHVTRLMPPEETILATSMTPQALTYMPQGSLCHQLIVAGERSRVENDDTAEATRALREMLSGGSLSKLVTMKGQDGRLQTSRVEQEGPIAFVESTTLQDVFEEDANRCLLLSIDERSEQTRRVLMATAKGGNVDPRLLEAITAKHHTAQRMLPRVRVTVPYARRLAELFPDNRVEARRAFPHLLGAIKACALLHHLQREQNGGELIAAPEDYALVYRLLRKPLTRLIGQDLSEGAIRCFDQLFNKYGNDASWTVQDGINLLEQGETTVRGYVKSLSRSGLARIDQAGYGSSPTYYRLTGKGVDLNGIDLPPEL